MAERPSGGEHRRHLARIRAGDRTDLIHAAMQRNQTALRYPMGDPVPAETGGGELTGRDDSLLASSERGDGRVANQ